MYVALSAFLAGPLPIDWKCVAPFAFHKSWLASSLRMDGLLAWGRHESQSVGQAVSRPLPSAPARSVTETESDSRDAPMAAVILFLLYRGIDRVSDQVGLWINTKVAVRATLNRWLENGILYRMRWRNI